MISCSLNPGSKSRRLAVEMQGALQKRNLPVELLDLREWPVPMCDGDAAYADDRVGQLRAKLEGAKCVLFSVPIYNYDVSAATKNLVELSGGKLEGKVVGFLCAAGGVSSYMSIMSFAASLMLDFRCLVVPRFVYATGSAFGPNGVEDAGIRQRVDDLAAEALRITRALSQ